MVSDPLYQPAATYMTIKELISMSYEMFGFISEKKIDKMRDSAKLEVSQKIKASSRKSLLRTQMDGSRSSLLLLLRRSSSGYILGQQEAKCYKHIQEFMGQ
ncbi:uncharacterized protein [Dysidea avara]|uniref:uncharacterized protein n=1 Tax=Dysidea avara TaxID=196820 RepID=UPI00331DB135